MNVRCKNALNNHCIIWHGTDLDIMVYGSFLMFGQSYPFYEKITHTDKMEFSVTIGVYEKYYFKTILSKVLSTNI